MTERPPVEDESGGEAGFHEVADDAPVMIWLTDPDGRCTYLSRRWYSFTGQTPETALGLGWLDATHPDDRAHAQQTFLEANAKRIPFEVDYRLRHRDGAYRWAIDFAAPRLAPDGEFLGYVGAVIDITDRKRAEDALAEREARFRALFSSIDEGYCLCEMVLDEEGRPVDYRFLEANSIFEEMTGLRDAAGRTAYELVPDLERQWVETYARVALGDAPLRFEQGSEAMGRWFDVFASPVAPRGRFALVFKDVTQRRRAELALRESEAAERRAREHAELLAEVAVELEATEGFEARVRCLAQLLVPRLGDLAAVAVPGGDPPLAAAGRGDTDAREAVRLLRERAGAADPVRLAAGGEEQLGAGAEPVRSHVAVPLELGTGVSGALLLGVCDPERPAYAADDLAFIRKLADRAGVLFASARLREAEHQIALRLQRALLPGEVLGHPRLEIAAHYEAGSDLLEVGGDWYDTFPLARGCVGLAVGDVVGHGLEAAAAMGRLRTALAALAPHADGPGTLVSQLDAFAVGANSAGFATALFAVLDPATGGLRYASAGHPPMLLVTPAGACRWLEDGRSPPLFGTAHADRREAAATMEPGSLLVLYSDGLVERRREAISAGMARLQAAASAAREAPVDEICARLIAELGVGQTRDDDVVVLCVRLLPAFARFHRRFPARPEELARLRAAVRGWAAGQHIDERLRSDLLLALSEACTNAIEHGYGGDGGAGEVEVEILRDAGHALRVRVQDTGRWHVRADGDADRGRGTGIMRALAADFTRRTGPEGTTVELRLAARGTDAVRAGRATPSVAAAGTFGEPAS